jgi:hypothetical protein
MDSNSDLIDIVTASAEKHGSAEMLTMWKALTVADNGRSMTAALRVLAGPEWPGVRADVTRLQGVIDVYVDYVMQVAPANRRMAYAAARS